MWSPCLQKEDILLGVVRCSFTQESRPLRAKLCAVYAGALEDQREDRAVRTERTSEEGSPEEVGRAVCGKGGQLWMGERAFPARGTQWVEMLRQEGAQYVPRTARFPRNGFICIFCDDQFCLFRVSQFSQGQI